MVNGRGAWNNAGVGGTKKYKSSEPGPYYYLGTGEGDLSDPNVYAVHRAVVAYQKVLRRKTGMDLVIDGIFGPQTSEAVTRFQNRHPEVGIWGGIGPDTSKALLYKDLERIWNKYATTVPINAVSGTVKQESLWDAGAVGYLDPQDVGLAQINAQAHPEWSTDQRLKPRFAFKFIISYHEENIAYFKGNLRDGIAAYNLGKGGATSWIRDGRPDIWTPPGQTRPRYVKQYIDNILAG